MTRDDFEQGYCKRSGCTVEDMRQYLVALPCGCPEEDCPGWAMVVSLTDAGLLIDHLQRSLPDAETLEAMSREFYGSPSSDAKEL